MDAPEGERSDSQDQRSARSEGRTRWRARAGANANRGRCGQHGWRQSHRLHHREHASVAARSSQRRRGLATGAIVTTAVMARRARTDQGLAGRRLVAIRGRPVLPGRQRTSGGGGYAERSADRSSRRQSNERAQHTEADGLPREPFHASSIPRVRRQRVSHTGSASPVANGLLEAKRDVEHSAPSCAVRGRSTLAVFRRGVSAGRQ